MGGRERNSDSTLQTFITGINTPSAEGGTAFFSPRLPPLFLFDRILAFWIYQKDNVVRKERGAKELRIDENF